MRHKLGIIGIGVMANAIIDCAINTKLITNNEIIVYDIDNNKLIQTAKKGIPIASSIANLIQQSDIVMLAVKPQHYANILLENDFTTIGSLISIMAGVKIATIREKLNNIRCGITRVMPNTPCQIGKGFCGLCFDKTTDKDKDFIIDLFRACGEVGIFTEDKFDAITSLSGSGPAYVYMFINGMIKGGMNGGLDYHQAKKMAISTMIGASHLAKQSDLSIEDLIESVCSKGGTTIEAIDYFRQEKLEQIIATGIDKCRNKSKYLSDNL